MTRALYAVALVVAVAGCESPLKPVDEQRSALMPEAAARQIAARYVGADWLVNPQLTAAIWCSPRTTHVPIAALRLNPNDIDYMVWAPGCSGGSKWFKVDMDKRHELTEALLALGARLQSP